MMQATTHYSFSPGILPCALDHLKKKDIQACSQCKDSAQKIEKSLLFWRECPELREAILEAGFKERVTVLNLKSKYLITEDNLQKLSTASTPEPIVFGYSEELGSPFLVIRYIDEDMNRIESLPEKVKSFVTVILGEVPCVGYEFFMSEYWHTENGEMDTTSTFNVDGGVGITKHLVSLIKGQLDGKKIE